MDEGRCRFFDKLKPFCVNNSTSVGDFNVWRTKLDAPSRSSFKRDELREVKGFTDESGNDGCVEGLESF